MTCLFSDIPIVIEPRATLAIGLWGIVNLSETARVQPPSCCGRELLSRQHIGIQTRAFTSNFDHTVRTRSALAQVRVGLVQAATCR